MDPEDLREVISAYQKCVAATVERFVGGASNDLVPNHQNRKSGPAAERTDRENGQAACSKRRRLMIVADRTTKSGVASATPTALTNVKIAAARSDDARARGNHTALRSLHPPKSADV